MTKKEELIKRIFETVYKWGRIGLQADENTPTFQSYMKELQELNQPQEEIEEIEEIKLFDKNSDGSGIQYQMTLIQLKMREHTRAINQLNEVVRKLNKRNNDPSPT